MTTNFLGIPIEGDIENGRRKRKEQKTKEELGAILQPLLEDPRVEGIRWHQYTPYFNDGDVCEFGVYAPRFRFEGMGEEAGDDYNDGYDDPDYSSDPALQAKIGGWEWKPKDGRTYGERVHNGQGDPELAAKVKAASDAIEGGDFEDVLLEAFGDHAEVTVLKDKIVVEFYEHD